MKFLKSLFNKQPQLPKTDLEKRFHLLGRVGQGSMSRVWRAHDSITGKPVALKILDTEKPQRFESRFMGLNKPTEGQVAASLHHRNIVRTFECGVSTKRQQFLVMEFINGVSLSYLVEMQNQTMRDNRLRFILEFGDALYYFHRQNWIHRDVCPRNVLLDTGYQVKLIDFGLAVPNTPPFRKPGNRTGTVSYMAPELIKRQPTDQRIDIFSFAASCYEMFTQQLPWDHSDVSLETVLQHINRPPVDIRDLEPGVDDQVADAIMKGLATLPNDRWSSMEEMLKPFWEARMRLEGAADGEKYRFLMEEKDREAAKDRAQVARNAASEEALARDMQPVTARRAPDGSQLAADDDEYEDVTKLATGNEEELDLDRYFEIASGDDDDDEYEAV
ncbi:MAG: serine/threonine-protein kinase [Planctomycetaceae bacterium]